ncbi:MAG: efflux RND transporter permease subunit [Planctomycetales bacterium]|nr:efflux RND transporter permease subunit [Planctomycetales bacterium]
MRAITRWAIANAPAINILMIMVMLVGLASTLSMRREDFPSFDLEIILVTVPYPGATPSESEEGICQKIEESVRGIDGVNKVTSVAQEGSASVVLELDAKVRDPDRVLDEVRAEVDRIPSFPEEAEDPEVRRQTVRQPAIRVGVLGPDSNSERAEMEVREVAEQVRNLLLQKSNITQVEFLGAKDYQIDIEISEEQLRAHGLTLQQAADIVRRENRQLPAGTLRSPAQEVLLRSDNRRTVGDRIGQLPLVTNESGAVLTVADLGKVSDEFADGTLISRIDGQLAVAMSVQKTDSEDMLKIVSTVKETLATDAQMLLPPGYSLTTWGDRTVEVRSRINLLLENGAQGLLLVFLLLAIFLELRLAFWVAAGIPFALLATSVYLYSTDQTLNMLSMFGFVMALGIVVDDAIVVGENVYAHRQMGRNTRDAALAGTLEVAPSVTASVSTTVIAFMPLLFVSGVMGKFMAVMPVAIIGMLLVSLVECVTILPCHLAHEDSLVFRLLGGLTKPFRWTPITLSAILLGTAGLWWLLGGPAGEQLAARLNEAAPVPPQQLRQRVLFTGGALLLLGGLSYIPVIFGWINRAAESALDAFIGRVYLPTLKLAIKHQMEFIACCIAVLIVSVGVVRSGRVPFAIFPKLDGNSIQASVSFPDGTPGAVTERWMRKIEEGIQQVDERYRKEFGAGVVTTTYRIVGQQVMGQGPGGAGSASRGSHVGSVEVELQDVSLRPASSADIIREWREAVGPIPGAESIKFQSVNMGPGGIPIEFKLLAEARHVDELERAVERCKERLAEEPGVFDIADDSAPGKWELRLRVKEDAIPLGIRNSDLAETVRASYYGAEVMRLQRGRHEVKLMVRYPSEERRSLTNLREIRIRTEDGIERPLTEVADVEIVRGYSEINRVDQLRSITVSADLDEKVANARQIIQGPQGLKNQFIPNVLAKEFPNVQVRWEGQQQQTSESVGSLMRGLVIAMFGMFILLVVEFKSYLQPLLVMMIIPFGLIGAIIGHGIQGIPLTMFSLFGLVALTGIVVNDSIVLIDFINHRVRAGVPVNEALLQAGQRRFRPVMLTTITTVAGLLPILLETSLQAQVLIPMATSIAFGEIFATVLVLYLMPVSYWVYASIVGADRIVHAEEPLAKV